MKGGKGMLFVDRDEGSEIEYLRLKIKSLQFDLLPKNKTKFKLPPADPDVMRRFSKWHQKYNSYCPCCDCKEKRNE